MLKYMLLGLLQYQPMSGYDLEQFISTSTAHFWHAKLSQIYRTLKKMEEDEGLVTSHMELQEGRPDRRVYKITEDGLQELRKWQAQYMTAPDEVKLPALLRLFLMGTAPDSTIMAQFKLWEDMYQQQHHHFRDELPHQIEILKQQIPHTEKDVLFWEATRRFGELYYEMYTKWLAETAQNFEQLTNQS